MNKPSSCSRERVPAIGRHGFTLVELLMVIAVLSIASIGMVSVFRNFSRLLVVDSVRIDVRQTLRSGMDFMAREIQQAGFDPTGAADAGIEVAEARRLRFSRNLWDASRRINDRVSREHEEQITYVFDADRRTLFRILYEDVLGDPLSGSSQPLIDDVTDCEFAYFDREGAFLGNDPADPAEIRSVEIRLRMEKPAAMHGVRSAEIRSRVFCRNL